MKKKLIAAGAASLAVATMPFAGVFAVKSTDQVTDTLTLNLQPTCTMTVSSAAATGSDAAGATVTNPTAKSSTYTATIAADVAYTLGTSTFTVICNDTTGWGVTVTANDLVGQTSGHTTEKFVNGSIPATSADSTPGAYSYTTAPVDAQSGVITDSGLNKGITAGSETGDGVQFTSTYRVRANSKTQTAQQYTGTVVYNLSSNADQS